LVIHDFCEICNVLSDCEGYGTATTPLEGLQYPATPG
jgi:hypothetical protein